MAEVIGLLAIIIMVVSYALEKRHTVLFGVSSRSFSALATDRKRPQAAIQILCIPSKYEAELPCIFIEGRQMKSKQLNDWLQVMASIGVVIGLTFVALELRENSRVATEQGISAMSGAYSNFLSRLDDPSARDVLIRAMEESGEFSLEESLQLTSLYLELLNGAEADFVIGESRGLSSDISVTGALSTTIWLSNRHGRAFWKNTRVLYTPEFAALVDSGMDGRANGFGAGWLKSIGVGATSDSSSD